MDKTHICPLCRSGHTKCYKMTYQQAKIYREYICLSCDAQWSNRYEFMKTENIWNGKYET